MNFSSEFIIANLPLNWKDVLWGYRHKLIGWRTPVDIAVARTNDGQLNDPLVDELSVVDKDSVWRVGEILDELAEQVETSDEFSKKRWLYLSLLLLQESVGDQAMKLQGIEEIYTDFDYPEEIAGFVPYMPSTDGFDPGKHTFAENCDRIMAKLNRYLEETKLWLV
jgi:hypothetical protein